MKRYQGAVLILFLAVFLMGCSQQQEPQTVEKMQKEPESAVPVSEPKIIGPSGCASIEECNKYCLKNPFDCKAWCTLESNKDVCDKYSIKIDIPDGIPGAPCTSDSECLTTLCLNFKCDVPSPDNMAKRQEFKLPGGCTSMETCISYCTKPENTNQCNDFCESFPSFCIGLSEARASAATPECQECTKCNAKECILECTNRCYAYMPAKIPNTEELKQGINLARNFQAPIKAVWEPGPAFNRIGLTYFIDDYKEIGVNTYSITPKYTHKDGKLTHTVDHANGEGADKEKIANIIKAKKAGFQVVLVAHDLVDLFPDFNPNKNEKISHQDYLDDVEETALKWAKVAEEYKVEYFVPVNEFEYMLYENGYSAEQACDITNSLYKKIIPQVREIFKGKIYCRVGGMDAKFGCMDFSQCDIFGFTYGFSGGNSKSNFDSLFAAGEQVSKKQQKPYIMAESFAFKNQLGNSEFIKFHNDGIQSYKDKAENGMGFTFMGLTQKDPIKNNDNSIIGTELVDEYTDFFKSMGAD